MSFSRSVYDKFFSDNLDYAFDVDPILSELVEAGVITKNEQVHIELQASFQKKLYQLFRRILPHKDLICQYRAIDILKNCNERELSAYLEDHIDGYRAYRSSCGANSRDARPAAAFELPSAFYRPSYRPTVESAAYAPENTNASDGEIVVETAQPQELRATIPKPTVGSGCSATQPTQSSAVSSDPGQKPNDEKTPASITCANAIDQAISAMLLRFPSSGMPERRYKIDDCVPYSDLSDNSQSQLMVIPKLNKSLRPKIKLYHRVASYNWLYDPRHAKPVIVVPGMPNEFDMSFGGGIIPWYDSYDVRDPNAWLLPEAPLDPLFLSVKHMDEAFSQKATDFQQYDVIIDASTIMEIFDRVSGLALDKDIVSRIDLEIIGKTLLVNSVSKETVFPLTNTGTSTQFPDIPFIRQISQAFTKLTNGPFHQIVSYEFGDIKMLVRFEADSADYEKLSENLKKDLRSNEPLAAQNVSPFDLNQNLQYCMFGSRRYHDLIGVGAIGTADEKWPSATASTYGIVVFVACFFTGLNVAIGATDGNRSFEGKQRMVRSSDVNEVCLHPPCAPIVSKIYAFLSFLTNHIPKTNLDCSALLWKGTNNILLCEKTPDAPQVISQGVRAYLQSQVKGSLENTVAISRRSDDADADDDTDDTDEDAKQ